MPSILILRRPRWLPSGCDQGKRRRDRQEPGCRQFDIMVEAKNPNHVFLWGLRQWGGLTAHRSTDHQSTHGHDRKITGRNVRAMTPVAFNSRRTSSMPGVPSINHLAGAMTR
jgi:hypothetical protein